MISTEPTEPVRILVTGSRDWFDERLVHDELTKLLRHYGRILVVHGACPTGADAHAATWVRMFWNCGAREERHPAGWNKHRTTSGRKNPAGPIRNAEMVDLGARHCLAFVLNGSCGATGCADLADRSGVPTTRYTQTTGVPA